ncbi:MAG: AbrB/MazE/SpoVT family DNA-binding domain-containing protein [Candidatus Methanoperedens sp.]|nr:AbrB/MazE/SpoVT family DNA-binding domain-containing protein [Candidatus Methanoperedens sp.]
METLTISRKGQVVIPAKLRKKYGLKDGEKLIIEDEGSYIKIIPKTTDLTTLCGILKGQLDPKAVRKQIEEMRKDDEKREKLIGKASNE